MALLLRGKTLCGLCNAVIVESDNVCMYPILTANQADELYPFSDGAFHSSCIAKHPLKDRLEERMHYDDIMHAYYRRCYICAQMIDDETDSLALVHLTSDSAHPLFRFNQRWFHRSCFRRWDDSEELIDSINKLQDNWKGPVLEFVIAELRTCLAE